MTGYVLFWYLLGVKLPWGHTQKTRFWYLLGVAFKKSDEHPRHFYLGVPPGFYTIYEHNLFTFQVYKLYMRINYLFLFSTTDTSVNVTLEELTFGSQVE